MAQINDLQLFLEEERLGHKNTKIQVNWFSYCFSYFISDF